MSTLTANTIETNSLQAESGTGEIALPTGHKIVAADAGAFEQPYSPGQIIEVLAGVCDGRGDYIAKWEHPTLPRPTEEQLA